MTQLKCGSRIIVKEKEERQECLLVRWTDVKDNTSHNCSGERQVRENPEERIRFILLPSFVLMKKQKSANARKRAL